MNQEEYRQAATYWEPIDEKAEKMPREELLAEMEKFIKANDTCALATSYNGVTRCTPIEYKYYDGKLYILSEGGQKFNNLEHNKNICIAIFDKFQGFAKVKGMQITGTVEVFAPYSEGYVAAAEKRHLNVESLKKRNVHLYMLVITPNKIEFTNGAFREKGYFVRQSLEF